MLQNSRNSKVVLLEDDPQREAEQAVAPVESHGNGLCIACIVYGFVSDILGNVENADVVLEVE